MLLRTNCTVLAESVCVGRMTETCVYCLLLCSAFSSHCPASPVSYKWHLFCKTHGKFCMRHTSPRSGPMLPVEHLSCSQCGPCCHWAVNAVLYSWSYVGRASTQPLSLWAGLWSCKLIYANLALTKGSRLYNNTCHVCFCCHLCTHPPAARCAEENDSRQEREHTKLSIQLHDWFVHRLHRDCFFQ